jgi:hypothetical protein
MWLRSVRRKVKNNSGKTSLMFFRFAVVLRAYSKWGVPQSPESNTKVLLMNVQ